MGWHGAGGWWILWPLGWVVFLFLLFGIGRWVCFARPWWGPYGGGPHGYWGSRHDPGYAVLRERLARGEIDEDEYNRLKKLLNT